MGSPSSTGTLRGPDSSKATVGSASSGALTNDTKRESLLGVVEHGLPLVLVALDVTPHRGLEVVGDPERVLAHDGPEMLEPALERVEPGGRALEAVGRADVEHEEAVDVAHEGLVVEVAREQPRMGGRLAAVAADVEVPALVGRDDADVLAAGLGTLAGTPRDAELDLVRRPQPAVAVLEVDGHPDRVLHAVAAPRRADARLHGAQRLAVGLPRLHADVDEALPDRGRLLDAGAEEVDALAAGDLDVEPRSPWPSDR